jgi:hypothetical protein
MTNIRYAPKYFVREGQKHEARKVKAKELGEKYYALAQTHFARSDYFSASRLCAIGMTLSTGPFMLAVRDQLEDLWARCDRLLASNTDSNHWEFCAIRVQDANTTMPKVHLAFLNIDEVAELENKLLAFKESGVIENYEVFPSAGTRIRRCPIEGHRVYPLTTIPLHAASLGLRCHTQRAARDSSHETQAGCRTPSLLAIVAPHNNDNDQPFPELDNRPQPQTLRSFLWTTEIIKAADALSSTGFSPQNR